MDDQPVIAQSAELNRKPIHGIDWNAVFAARPDLEPPGYKETVELMKQKRTLNDPLH